MWARRFLGWMVIAVLAGAAVACGGDGGGVDETSEPGATTEPEAPSEPAAASETSDSPAVADGPVDLTGLDEATQVAPTLDDTAATIATVGLDGGTLTATGADGTTYTLTIPADSMRHRSTITMTPLSALDGLPFGDGTALAVDLQPSGLLFDVPAVLAIEPATPIPAGEQVPITYQGTELTIARPVMDSAGIEIEIPHFSGYGVAKGLLGDVEEARRRLGGSAEARIGSEINAMLAEAQQRERAGAEPDPQVDVRFREYLRQYEREVIAPRIAAAGNSCAEGRLAIETYLSHERTLELLGYAEDDSVSEAQALMDTAARVCIEEEYEMCVEQHVVHRLIPLWLGFARMAEMFEGVGADVVAQAAARVEDCLRFEFEFSTTAGGESNWSAMNVRSEDTATFTAEAVFDTGAIRFARSSGPMESVAPVYEIVATGCSGGTPDGWSASADFVDMGWSAGGGELTEELGHVEDLEVWIELPDAAITVVGMTCGGTDAGPVIDHGVSAPNLYRDLHGDEIITEWTLVGGETFATAQWETEKVVETGTLREHGTAILRHTPR